MKMWLRGSVAALAALTLAACASKPVEDDGAVASGINNIVPVTAPYAAGSQEEFEQAIGNTVLFNYDQATLRSEAVTVLSRQADWLSQYPSTIVSVEGHADERGTRDYNIGLGARRAEAVKDFLLANGIESGRISTVSYGKERQICTVSEESCWSQNRRVVSVVQTSGQQASR